MESREWADRVRPEGFARFRGYLQARLNELRGLTLGAQDYLHKPISKELLRMRIALALGKPAGWTPGVSSEGGAAPDGEEEGE